MLGGIRYVSPTGPGPEIEVRLSALKPEFTDPLNNSSLIDPNGISQDALHRSVWLPAGLISLLVVGSVWHRGNHQPSRASGKVMELYLRAGDFEMLRWGDHIEIVGENQDILGAFQYRVGGDAAKALQSSWIMAARHVSLNCEVLIIPSAVIFQRCLATSPKAVKRLLVGDLGRLIADDYSYIDSEPSAFYVNLWKDIEDREAPSLANLVADRVAHDEYSAMRNEFVVKQAGAQVANHRTKTPSGTHIKLGFPYSQPFAMVVKGKAISYQNRDRTTKSWGLLVSEIVTIRPTFPFSTLVIDRKNKNFPGENKDDPDLIESWAGARAAKASNVDPQGVTSENLASALLEALCVEASGAVYPGALRVVKEDTDVQKYRAATKSNPDACSNGEAATGEVTSRDTGTAPLGMDQVPMPETPISIQDFIEVIEIIRKRGIDVHTHAIAAHHIRDTRSQVVINFLPKRIGKLRNWHFIDDGDRQIPRAYIVASLYGTARNYYLIELQRKERCDESGELSIACISEVSGAAIAPAQIAQFMRDVATRKGWRPAIEEYKAWRLITIKHRIKKPRSTLADDIINHCIANAAFQVTASSEAAS